MDTEKLFKKIMKRIRTGELIIQSVDELKMDRKAVLIGIDSDGQQRTGPSNEIHLEIKLTVIPKVKHGNMETKIVDHRDEIMMFGERVGWRVCHTDGTWEAVWLKDDSDKGSK